MKKIIYSSLGLILLLVNNIITYATNTETKFGYDKVDEGLINGNLDLVTILDNMLGYIIGLFYFVSIVIGIYGGFTILTSIGDDEKVKKGKNIIIYVVLGLIVIFLTSQLINWVINVMTNPEIVGGTS